MASLCAFYCAGHRSRDGVRVLGAEARHLRARALARGERAEDDHDGEQRLADRDRDLALCARGGGEHPGRRARAEGRPDAVVGIYLHPSYNFHLYFSK